MNKLVIIIFLSQFYLNTIYSQWYPINTGSSSDLFSIDHYGTNTLWLGGLGRVVKTNDGGSTWTSSGIYDDFGVNIPLAYMYDIALTSSSSAIGTGNFYTGNVEYILRTTNSGANWNIISSNNSVPLVRGLNAIDMFSTRAVIVGNNGRIARSTNAGASWTFVSSGTTMYIEDVKFISIDTLLAVGYGGIMKSVNGGISWILTPFTGTHKTLSIKSSSIYIGNESSYSMVKSTDNGVTFNTISLPFLSNGNIYALSKDTVLASSSSGLYLSVSGGQYWEKFILPNYKTINVFHFMSSTKGYAAGNSGYVLRTDSINAAPRIPISGFTIGGKGRCIGDTVSFINASIPNCNYKWFVNGNFYSNNYNTGMLLTSPGNYNITMVASNAFGSDTSNTLITALSISPIDTFSILSSVDTICDNSNVKFTIPVSQVDASYQLRRNNKLIGSIMGGNGSSISLSDYFVSGTNTYDIVGWRWNNCIYDTFISASKLVYSRTIPDTAEFYFSSDTVCYNAIAYLIIPNSRYGYVYTWNNPIDYTTGTNFINGNGATIYIPLPDLLQNQSFGFLAIHTATYCTSIVKSKTIIVDPIIPYFTLNNANPEVGESIYTLNNSVNPTGSYSWDFDANASTRNFTTKNPYGISYNSAGAKRVRLTNATTFGCTDSLIKHVNVITPFTEDSCRFTQFMRASTQPIAIRSDYNENLIALYLSSSDGLWRTYSSHGDSLGIDFAENLSKNNLFVFKYNNKGIPLWYTRIRCKSPYIRCGAIETDTAGNSYITFFHGEYNDSVRVYSADNSYVSFITTTIAETIIIKYNKDGILQWYNTTTALYTARNLGLKCDYLGNLYAVNGSNINKYNNKGQLVWSKAESAVSIEIDTNGHVWVLRNNLILVEYDTSGSILFTTNSLNFVIAGGVESKYIKIDELNNIYIAGSFQGKFVFGNDTVTDIYTSGNTHQDIILCKMRSNGKQEWIKQFKSESGPPSLCGIDVKENHIILVGVKNLDTVFVKNFSPIYFLSKTGYFIYHVDSVGGTESLLKFYETKNLSSRIGSSAYRGSMISFNRKSSDLSFLIDFDSTFTFFGKTIKPFTGVISYSNDNSLICRGSLNCLLSNVPIIRTTNTHFLASASNICEYQSVSFADMSSNHPTSWNWTFIGGTPATSSLQNPIVTYSSPGIYYVTLSTANGFGIGTTSTRRITVVPNVNPNVIISGDTIVCVGGTANYLVSSFASGLKYQWQDSSANHTWSNIEPEVQPNLIVKNVPISFKGKKYRCIVTNNCSSYISEVLTLNVNPLVSLNLAQDTICLSSNLIALTGGTPSGGVYSGKGVANGFFNASIAGGGIDTIWYTYTDPNLCTNKAYALIYVNASPQFYITGNTYICGGQRMELKISSLSRNYSYQWQDSTSGHTWSNIYLQTDSIFEIDSVLASQNGSQYR